MHRRRCLQLAGLGVGLATSGCLGGGSTTAANEFGYETTVTDGVAVPLVPIADAIEWYEDDAALFGDARSRTAFERAHIRESVFTPAPDGQSGDDPVESRAADTRVVTYCGCPHHLSSMRAASLIDGGYPHVYALDEGFYAWTDAGYPVEGSAVDTKPASYTITGRLDPGGSRETVWAWHDPTGQREATSTDDAGRFTLQLHFYDVTPESSIRLVGPEQELTRPLGVLTDTEISL